MSRVKGAVHALKKRRTILKRTKGYIFGRSTKERQAREAFLHAGVDAFRDRRRKKSDFRRLFTVRLNAGLREAGITYSKFMGALTKKGIELNRKVLSEIAHDTPEALKRIVAEVK
jgi:large subunit ribosomal protein L20